MILVQNYGAFEQGQFSAFGLGLALTWSGPEGETVIQRTYGGSWVSEPLDNRLGTPLLPRTFEPLPNRLGVPL